MMLEGVYKSGVGRYSFTADAPNKPLSPLPKDARSEDDLAYREASTITGADSTSIEFYGWKPSLILTEIAELLNRDGDIC